MKPYIIVIAKNLIELEDSVGLLFIEGYFPIGGPAQLGGNFTQAVYQPNICAMFQFGATESPANVRTS